MSDNAGAVHWRLLNALIWATIDVIGLVSLAIFLHRRAKERALLRKAIAIQMAQLDTQPVAPSVPGSEPQTPVSQTCEPPEYQSEKTTPTAGQMEQEDTPSVSHRIDTEKDGLPVPIHDNERVTEV